MLNPDCVYMLAADHRWQWEEWCDAHAVARTRIPEIKRLAYDGFVHARGQSTAVRNFGALLIDEQYASTEIADGLRDGVDVGTPAERPGAFPLEWTTDPFERALTGAFVKVLVRYRPEQPIDVRDAQIAKLLDLQTWCRSHGKPLVVEILVSRDAEPEEAFEATGRPAIVGGLIRLSYERGLAPEFWKIEGTHSPEGARTMDRAIAEHPSCRQIILGKGASATTIGGWFVAAAHCHTAVGFAIGRSVVWDPATQFLSGTTSRDRAVAAIAANYLSLVDAWETRSSATHSAV